MSNVRGRNEKKQPKTKKTYKRKEKKAAPNRTAQITNYARKKLQDERKRKEDAQNSDYAVNAAEDAAVDLTLEAAYHYQRRQQRHHPAKKPDPPKKDSERPQGQQAENPQPQLPPGDAADPERLPAPGDTYAPAPSLDNEVAPAYSPSNTPAYGGSRSTPSVSGAKASPQGGTAASTPTAEPSRLEPRQKPRYTPKTRPDTYRAAPRTDMAAQAAQVSANAQRAAALGRDKLIRETQRELTRQTKKTAKISNALAQKAATAVLNALRSAADMMAVAFGGIALVALLGIVLLVGGIAASPMGILFSEEATETSVALSTAVGQIELEYTTKLNELREGDYAEIQIEGAPPDWNEVLAVFAVRATGDGMTVLNMDAERIELLRSTFWDMCAISSEEEPAETIGGEPGTEPDPDATEPLPTLHITISSKTAEDMRQVYSFTPAQNKMLDELLAQGDKLMEMLSDLAMSPEADGLLTGMPTEVSATRKKVVQQALSLKGKVHYFWGGKSRVIGWDERWGKLYKVTAPGSPTTGTTRPYGLDCSGFTDWVFYNVSGGSYLLGHGGGAATQHTYCKPISWDEAQPGDLAFYPGDSHVGIIGGWDEAGNIQIIHCASGNLNNVVVTGKSGFTTVGRPYYYGE